MWEPIRKSLQHVLWGRLRAPDERSLADDIRDIGVRERSMQSAEHGQRGRVHGSFVCPPSLPFSGERTTERSEGGVFHGALLQKAHVMPAAPPRMPQTRIVVASLGGSPRMSVAFKPFLATGIFLMMLGQWTVGSKGPNSFVMGGPATMHTSTRPAGPRATPTARATSAVRQLPIRSRNCRPSLRQRRPESAPSPIETIPNVKRRIGW